MIDLVACPWCGKTESVRAWKGFHRGLGVPLYVVECKGCDCGGPSSTVSPERAAELWNRRAPGAIQ